MCEPVTIGSISFTAAQSAMMGASLALSAVTKGVQFMGQSQATAQQNAYQNAQAEQRNAQIAQTQAAARQAFITENEDANRKLRLEREQASQKRIEGQIDLAQAIGTAKAKAAGGNKTGLSVDALMQDMSATEARFQTSINRNLDLAELQNDLDLEAANARFTARANSVAPYIPAPVSGPSVLGAVVGLGGAAFKAANQYGGLGEKLSFGRTTATDPNFDDFAR